MEPTKAWKDAVVGDIVKHPSDGDIGVIIKIYTDAEGDKYHSIFWQKDGLMSLMRYRPLEVITDTICPGDISST